MLESMKRLFEVERVKGMEEGKTEGATENTMHNIRSLTETLRLTVDEAMDALQVPIEKREYYRSKLIN